MLDTCTAAAAKKPELEAGLAAVRNGLTQAETKKAELTQTIESLKEAQKAIDAGRETLKQEEAKLEPAKNRLPQTKRS